jgi:hypothetical protein
MRSSSDAQDDIKFGPRGWGYNNAQRQMTLTYIRFKSSR